MSWKEKLKGALFEDDGSQKPATPAPAATPTPTAPPLTVVSSGGRSRSTGNVDPEFLQALQETVDQAVPPILVTFKQLLEGLAEVVPDESSRYRAAIKSLTTTGKGTPEQLKSALAERMRALDRAKTLFLGSLDDKTKRDIKAKQGEVDNLDEQVKSLTEQLSELQVQRNTLQAEIDTSQAEINAKQAKFDAAYEAVQTALKSDGDKIAAFLS